MHALCIVIELVELSVSEFLNFVGEYGESLTNNPQTLEYSISEDADDTEIEFILNDEVQKFNAEIVQVDKTNDLAIIKIFDMNFDGVDELPYNLHTVLLK